MPMAADVARSERGGHYDLAADDWRRGCFVVCGLARKGFLRQRSSPEGLRRLCDSVLRAAPALAERSGIERDSAQRRGTLLLALSFVTDELVWLGGPQA